MADQKQLQPVEVRPDMSNEQADALGVIGFTYAMNQRMTECRNMGKAGWHKPGTIDPVKGSDNEIERFKNDLLLAAQEGRMVDAANYCMMIYHRERMKNSE